MARWTSDEEAKVKRLFAKGLTHKAIAKKMTMRSPKAVMYRCNSLGLTRVVEKNWNREEERRVLSMRVEGFDFEEIARILGRTITSVKVKICRLKKII